MSGTSRKKRLFDAWIDASSNVGGGIAALCLLTTALIIFYETFMRYLFNAPTIWVKEISIYLCIAIGFLGAAYALKQGNHFSVTFVVEKLTARGRRNLKIITHIAGIFYSAIFVYKGTRMVMFSYEFEDISSGLLEVPLWIPKLLIPVGSLLLGFQFLRQLLTEISEFKKREDVR